MLSKNHYKLRSYTQNDAVFSWMLDRIQNFLTTGVESVQSNDIYRAESVSLSYMCSVLSNNRWYTGIFSKSPVRIMHNRSIVICRVLKMTYCTFGKLTCLSVFYVIPVDRDVIISITSCLLVLVT